MTRAYLGPPDDDPGLPPEWGRALALFGGLVALAVWGTRCLS